MTTVTGDDTPLRERMMAMLRRDLPAGIDPDMDLMVDRLVDAGSMEPLLQARQVYAQFDVADHDSNVLSMMTRLVTRGWTVEDLAGLREDWPATHGYKAVYHLYRFANYHTEIEGLPAEQIRAGMRALYPWFTVAPGPYLSPRAVGDRWPWPWPRATA
ncbi:hypothetical protein [Actinoplanes sp. URMC 104]|uniref:hypothetical protein n=1 Tax=Actinoplanes sp. URMC 104 TaxID=3423409 RepID=UPI003F1CE603